jgi:hypothetical protein
MYVSGCPARVDGHADSRSKLRDIFRVHPNTACHTHELLECPCDATGIKARARSAGADDDKDADGADSEDDFDDEERKLVRTFQAASQLRPEDLYRVDKAVSSTYLLYAGATDSAAPVHEEEEG